MYNKSPAAVHHTQEFENYAISLAHQPHLIERRGAGDPHLMLVDPTTSIIPPEARADMASRLYDDILHMPPTPNVNLRF